MRRPAIALLGFLLGVLAVVSAADAGARDGKIRWQSNKDVAGRAKLKQPIRIEANNKVELRIVFKAGELAEFVCIGDGDCDIDVLVSDAGGTLVAKDVDPAERGSDLCVCRWRPQEQQEYTITIINNDPKLYSVVTAGCN